MSYFEEMYPLEIEVDDENCDFYLADPQFTFIHGGGPDPDVWLEDLKAIEFYKEVKIGEHTQMVKVTDKDLIKTLKAKFTSSYEYIYAAEAALERHVYP